MQVAAAILAGNQFGGDQHVLKELLSQVTRTGVPESGAIMAICGGGGQTAQILMPGTLTFNDKTGPAWHPPSIFGSFTRGYRAKSSFQHSGKIFRACTPIGCLMRALSGPVLNRAKRDAGVRDALLEGVRKDASPHVKASFPRILVECGDFREELVSRVRTELASQLDRKQRPEVGF